MGSHLAQRSLYRRDGQHCAPARAFGTGKQTRYVGEVVEALVRLARAPDVETVRRLPSVAKLEAFGYRPKMPIRHILRMVDKQMRPNFERREAESTQ